MKLKKVVSLTVAAALVASMAASIGSASAATTKLTPEKNAKLLVWDDKEQKPFWNALIPKFKAKYKNYNITVKYQIVGGPDQDEKFATDAPAGIAADVGVIPHDNLAKLVEAGLWLPNTVFKADTIKNNVKAGVTAATYGGKLYGYPKSIETYALFYNKKLVKKAPTSWSDIFALAKNSSIQNPAQKKYAFMMEVNNFYFDYSFLTAGGGYVFGKDGTKASDIGLNNAGSVAGVKFFKSLKKILPLKVADITYDVKESLFQKGKLAVDLNGSWAIKGYREAGLDIGVAKLPSINGKQMQAFSGVKIVGVNAYSRYPKAAMLLANFATNGDAQLLNYKKTGVLPTNKNIANNKAIKSDVIVQGFLAQLKSAEPMPSIAEMGAVWSPMGAALADVWDKGADPKTALDTAVSKIKKAIK
jgi:arabinogalactan oligomer/maltooligosaccharide transport system substrate-binding protein